MKNTNEVRCECSSRLGCEACSVAVGRCYASAVETVHRIADQTGVRMCRACAGSAITREEFTRGASCESIEHEDTTPMKLTRSRESLIQYILEFRVIGVDDRMVRKFAQAIANREAVLVDDVILECTEEAMERLKDMDV
jgi:hypothetical protein